MAREDDTQAIYDACERLGPLTLTRAGYEAGISRWRAYVAIKAGVVAGTLNWTRVGANWLVAAILIDPPPEP